MIMATEIVIGQGVQALDDRDQQLNKSKTNAISHTGTSLSQ